MDNLTDAIITVNLLPSNYSLRTDEEKAIDKVVQAAVAFNAINRRTQPENNPLTLEELRQMDGEPVYCVGAKNKALDGWGLVSVKENRIFDNAGDWWDLEDCGVGYKAYAHKPEQEEK